MPSAFIIKLIQASWILQAILKVRNVYFFPRQINVSFWQVLGIRQCFLVPLNRASKLKNHTFQSNLSTQLTRDQRINLNCYIGTTFATKGHFLDEIKRQSSPMVIPLFNGRRFLSKRNPS